MPDAQGALTTEEKEQAVRWIGEKGGYRRVECTICGHAEWIIGDHLVAPWLYYGDGPKLGKNSYPLVQLICMVCGHTEFLNATAIGIVPQPRAVRLGVPEPVGLGGPPTRYAPGLGLGPRKK